MFVLGFIMLAAGIAILYSLRAKTQRCRETRQEDIIRAMQERIAMDNEMMEAMKAMMQSASAMEHSTPPANFRRRDTGGGRQ